MRKKSKFKVQSSKSLNNVAFLWDESFLWGLMAYKSLKANGLPFDLIRAEDIKKGSLKNYAMLFIPGGWASNKLKSLGNAGIAEIKKFVRNGGNYLGFCGGAGLATLDGIGLLDIKRKPTKERVPSFSGRIHLNINEHPIWCSLSENVTHPSNGLSCSPLTTHHSSLVFNAWWPSQFLIEDNGIKILATYSNALPDSFSSDLNVGDVEANGRWSELEEIYQINLNPDRLKNEPAVIEGLFGKGKVILSLIHFDTPDDIDGAVVLKNLWKYLGDQRSAVSSEQSNPLPPPFTKGGQGGITTSELNPLPITHDLSLITELEQSVSDLITTGIRNFLWFWRNPMLLQWRRGIRGLEYCTLYVMIKEIAGILGDHHTLSVTDHLLRIRELLIPFVEKAKELLVLERYALQNGRHITYAHSDDYEIQKIRAKLFTGSKGHDGLFKDLIDEIDSLLFSLIRQREEAWLRH